MVLRKDQEEVLHRQMGVFAFDGYRKLCVLRCRKAEQTDNTARIDCPVLVGDEDGRA